MPRLFGPFHFAPSYKACQRLPSVPFQHTDWAPLDAMAAAGAEPVSADEFREFCRNALVQREILSRLPTEAMN